MITEQYQQLENSRAATQLHLDAQRSAKERNRLGQFATPLPLALEITRYVHGLLEAGDLPVRFADPAIGTGAFFSALCSVFPRDQIAAAAGVEIDARFVSTARKLWSEYGLQVTEGDFTQGHALWSGLPRPNLILTNPPYVRHHHVDLLEKQRLREEAFRHTRLEVNGLSGLYVYFLLIAHGWLEEEGVAAWLIPSEFMDVNYGDVVRRYLRERVTLLTIHRFDPHEVQFDDALVSSAVVVFRKAPPPPDHRARFTFGGSLLYPSRSQEVSLPELGAARKWTAFPLNGQESAPTDDLGYPTLGDFFRIQRGLATGANEFFILPRAEAHRLELPEEYLQPILPGPRYLRQTVIEREADGYPAIDQQLCLINCDLDEATLSERYPALWRYLSTAEETGIKDRYLVRARKPWYRQETRKPSPFFCTYMGRGADKERPFRFLWNRSDAVVTNLYLILHPIGRMKCLLDRDPSAAGEVFRLLGEITGDDLRLEGRVYGGGLHKIEPKELGRISGRPLVERFPELYLDLECCP